MDNITAKNKKRPQPHYWAIIPAAGMGRRMGTGVAKQYLRIGHRTVLELTVERLHKLGEIEAIVLVLSPFDSSWKFLNTSHFANIVTVAGGEERSLSVWNGLEHLRELAADDDWVLVHDAVRPCVAVSDIARLMSSLENDPVGGLLATPIKETVKKANKAGVIEETLDRKQLWLAATPQMFRYGILREAMEAALKRQVPVTDEASAVEAMGYPVRLIQGRADNIKITHPEDLKLAEFILKNEKP